MKDICGVTALVDVEYSTKYFNINSFIITALVGFYMFSPIGDSNTPIVLKQISAEIR